MLGKTSGRRAIAHSTVTIDVGLARAPLAMSSKACFEKSWLTALSAGCVGAQVHTPTPWGYQSAAGGSASTEYR